MTQSITIKRPNDLHVHFRDGDMLDAVVPYTARQMGRAIVMPNLVPPVTTADMADKYRNRIMNAVPDGCDFTPLMTCYLTDKTNPDDLAQGHADGIFTSAKLYPAGATTNSEFGVTDVKNIYPVLQVMADIGMPLNVHGEVTRANIDFFDREATFVSEILSPIRETFPTLKIIMEHITTRDAGEFLQQAGDNTGATITPQHLLYNRNALFNGGIKPHLFCLPILKKEPHREFLTDLVTSGFDRIFLGTDTAPHTRDSKECACGCAGVFSAVTAIELYTHVFDIAGKLDKLESFASINGAKFYGFAPNHDTITLEKSEQAIPMDIALANGQTVHPLLGGETLPWTLQYT